MDVLTPHPGSAFCMVLSVVSTNVIILAAVAKDLAANGTADEKLCTLYRFVGIVCQIV